MSTLSSALPTVRFYFLITFHSFKFYLSYIEYKSLIIPASFLFFKFLTFVSFIFPKFDNFLVIVTYTILLLSSHLTEVFLYDNSQG